MTYRSVANLIRVSIEQSDLFKFQTKLKCNLILRLIETEANETRFKIYRIITENDIRE